MLSFKQYITELKKPKWEVPGEPGTAPIPKDHVRLYHQTSSHKNLGSIKRKGILPHQPHEGPKGIYAGEKPFYGPAHHKPTTEFSVHKKDWHHPFVTRDKVEPKKIVANHKEWHHTVRYIDDDPELKKNVLSGEHDDLIAKGKKDHYAKAIRFVKRRHAAGKKRG
jgi:hypothetical protein